MGDGNSLPLVCAVVTGNFGGQSIVLCMCSGNVLLDMCSSTLVLCVMLAFILDNIACLLLRMVFTYITEAI